jgi:D-psicose/D-tagatose/L-ribulose 3-epimerase
LYKTVGDMDESVALVKQRTLVAKAMRAVCREAYEQRVVLALEPLNRFETNMLNTTAQGIAFCSAAGGKGVGLLLDTFHMHIEEKDTASAIKAAAAKGFLAHFHASENDRGTAGTGQVHWPQVAAALRNARYERWVMVESFSEKVVSIRTAASCWRPFFANEDEFVRDGLRFVRAQLGSGR